MAKKTSIRTIAKLAGCSISTVSNVLNNNSRFFSEATRKRVMKVVNAKRYISNASGRNLRTGRTETIGLLFYPPNADIFDSEFHISIMLSLQKTLSKNGYELLLSEYTKAQVESDQIPSFVMKGKADAMIILGGMPKRALQNILKWEIPTLMLDSYMPNVDSISTNGRKASRDATSYLISMGHRHIEYFLYGNDDYNSNMRALGFLDAVAEFGLDPAVCRVHNQLEDKQGAAHELEALLSSKKIPTAIMGANDNITTFLMSLVQSKGIRVPDDISFFGFDDVMMSTRCNPQLSTVHTDTSMLGEVGALSILHRLQNPDSPRINKIFDLELKIRDSVKNMAV